MNRQLERAADCLPPRLRAALGALTREEKDSIEEIRLRSDSAVIFTCRDGPRFLCSGRLSRVWSTCSEYISKKELEDCFERLCGYSVHAHIDSLVRGFVTSAGGNRAGICATAVTENGRVTGIRDVSSIDIRIAHSVNGAADEIYKRYYSGDALPSVIIAGAPGAGKTTVLRDLIRQLSGTQRGKFIRTAVCDERSELGAVVGGTAQNDIGLSCDIFDAWPKAQAITAAVRCFSPQLIVCDEVGSAEETAAIADGMNSGAAFAVSVHAGSWDELCRREISASLLKLKGFSAVVLIRNRKPEFYERTVAGNEAFGGGDADGGGCAFRKVADGEGKGGSDRTRADGASFIRGEDVS